jgi:hypothetical protein
MLRAALMFAGAAGWLIAQEAVDPSGWNQATALGVLGAVVFWLLMRELPQARKSYEESLAKRDEVIDKLADRIDALRIEWAKRAED